MKYIYINGKSTVAVEPDEGQTTQIFIDETEAGQDALDKNEFAIIAKRNRYSQFLNKQFENLIILSGAGTSVGVGADQEVKGEITQKKGKLLSHLWDDTEASLTKDTLNSFCDLVKYTDKHEGAFIKNLEKLLSCANAAKDYVTQQGKNQIDIAATIKSIEELIREKCELLLPENSPHEIFLERIAKRKVTLPRAKIFTLNYDTLFEQAARKSGLR